MKMLAKEIRRIRALIDVMEEAGGCSPFSVYYKSKKRELEILRGILGLMIKEEGEKS
jgi:hypothetical protein